MKKRIKPTDKFWVVITIDTAIGTWSSEDDDFNSDCVQGIFATEADALDMLKNQIEDYGGVGYVYACAPKKKVWQPPTPEKPSVRVTAL